MTDAEILAWVDMVVDPGITTKQRYEAERFRDALRAKFAAHERLRDAAQQLIDTGSMPDQHDLLNEASLNEGRAGRFAIASVAIRAALSDSPAPKCEHVEYSSFVFANVDWCRSCGAINISRDGWHAPGA